jgi:hypothetical protein
MKYNIEDCKIVNLDKINNRKGNITIVESGVIEDIDIKRVYYLYDVPSGESRGGHAHKELRQIIVATSGSFNVVLDDGKSKRNFHLNRPDHGLIIMPGIWREIYNFSSGSVCLVLASEIYKKEDYISSYSEFKEFVKL